METKKTTAETGTENRMREKYDNMRFYEGCIARLERCLEELKSFPYIVMSDSPYNSKPFYEQKETDKRYKPIPAIRDLPPDLQGVVKEFLEDRFFHYRQEFLRLLNEE